MVKQVLFDIIPCQMCFVCPVLLLFVCNGELLPKGFGQIACHSEVGLFYSETQDCEDRLRISPSQSKVAESLSSALVHTAILCPITPPSSPTISLASTLPPLISTSGSDHEAHM